MLLLLLLLAPHLLQLLLLRPAHLHVPRLVLLLLAEQPLLLLGRDLPVRHHRRRLLRRGLQTLTMPLLPLLLLLLRGRRLPGRLALGRVRIGRREEGVSLGPHHGNPFHDGVERRAGAALHSEEVPRAIVVGPLAVVADDGHGLGQVGGDGLQLDAHGHGIPRRLHPLVRFGRLLADGAAGIVGGQLAKAVPVDGVAAGHLVRGRAGAEEVLLADGAVGHVLAGLAVVIVEEEGVDAHAAIVAVLEVLPASDAAEAAVGTVVGLLLGRHPQVADVAMVLSEGNAALDALVAVVSMRRSVGGNYGQTREREREERMSGPQIHSTKYLKSYCVRWIWLISLH